MVVQFNTPKRYYRERKLKICFDTVNNVFFIVKLKALGNVVCARSDTKEGIEKKYFHLLTDPIFRAY